MTRLQATLLVVLATLAAVLAGRIVGPSFASTLAALPALAASVPAWVWWTAFSALWWLPFVFGKRSWRCGPRFTCGRPAPARA